MAWGVDTSYLGTWTPKVLKQCGKGRSKQLEVKPHVGSDLALGLLTTCRLLSRCCSTTTWRFLCSLFLCSIF